MTIRERERQAARETKACTRCKFVLPLEEFGVRRSEADGRNARCKPCARLTNRERYDANQERLRAEARERYAGPYHERTKARVRLWTAANPEKKAAHGRVKVALRNGVLVRPESCDGCGEPGRLDAHHDDYARPLDVRWLCRACHRAAHTYARSEAA